MDRDVRAGRLSERFDVVVIPDQSAAQLARGLGASYPDSLRGGLGVERARALLEFAESGGTILFFNEANEYGIEALKLPVRNVLAGVRNSEFYAPGSLLAVEINREHPIAAGFAAPIPAVWFEDSPTFEATDTARVSVVARYQTSGDPLLSGWLLGGDKLNGKAAMVDVSVGRGHAILYGFRPQYRGQTMATQSLIWGAITRK